MTKFLTRENCKEALLFKTKEELMDEYSNIIEILEDMHGVIYKIIFKEWKGKLVCLNIWAREVE